MSNLNVGDRVRCVNDSLPKDFKEEHYPNWVKHGKEYHIRQILNNDDIVVGVLLVEVVNPLLYIPLINALQEGVFATWRFEKTLSASEVYRETAKNTKVIHPILN